MVTRTEIEPASQDKSDKPRDFCERCRPGFSTENPIFTGYNVESQIMWRRRTWSTWLTLGLLLVVQWASRAEGGYPASVTGFYTDSSSQQTVLLDETLSPRQKKELRNEILRLLGLEHRPRVKARLEYDSVPQYMLELYRSLGDPAHSAATLGNLTLPGLRAKMDSADLIMAFVNQAGIQDLPSEGGRRFYFDFSEVQSTEGVIGSELRVYKFTTPWLFDRGPFTVKLFKIKNDQYKQESVMEETTTLQVHALAEGWLDIEATAALRHWVLEPEDQVLMYLQVTDSQGMDVEPTTIGLVDNTGPKDKQAFLVTCFKATHKLNVRRSRAPHAVRRKRSPAPSNYYSDEKDYNWIYPQNRPSRRACQRRQLYVSFKALGWQSWVIAPEGYPAFYCEGGCTFPLNVHMNATNHAIVQALVHLVKPFLVPNPYCAPTTLHGISFLYLDNNYNVVLKTYKNMVVQACGCH